MIIFVLHVVVGAVLIVFAVPLILIRVRPNGLYGWRTCSTLGDERAWYPVNRITGFWLLAMGLSVIAAASSALALRLTETDAAWFVLAVMVVFLVGLVIHGNVLIRRLKRENQNS